MLSIKRFLHHLNGLFTSIAKELLAEVEKCEEKFLDAKCKRLLWLLQAAFYRYRSVSYQFFWVENVLYTSEFLVNCPFGNEIDQLSCTKAEC